MPGHELTMKATGLIIRIVGLIALHFICFTFISAALLPHPSEEFTAAEAGAVVTGVLAVSILNTILLSYITLRARYTRWKLVLAIFLILYGVMTLMPQI